MVDSIHLRPWYAIRIYHHHESGKCEREKKCQKPTTVFSTFLEGGGALVVAQIDIVDFLSLREHIAAESFLKPQLDFVLV